MKYITMNFKEIEQAKVFAQVTEKIITQAEAAAKLRCSDRWIRKKIKRYRESGDSGLVHKNRGKTSPRRWDAGEEQLLIDLLKGEWQGFGPTFAAEKLEELKSIKISREVVRKSMIKAGLWEPKKTRGKHRKRRERRAMRGMLVQLDGSPHDWFQGRAEKCTLLVFIDDATSEILWLEFAKSESVDALMRATKSYIEKHGVPQAFYTDFGSVFHVNLNNKEGVKKTQWERACEELKITVHHARSPQAKGRVERCNQTMQNRLEKEMQLLGIDSIETANEYLRTGNFIAKHNAKFAVKAAQNGDAHAEHQSYNLTNIFTINETRILANDFTILFKKRIFQLLPDQRTILRPKNEIVVKTHLDGTIALWIRQTLLSFKEIKDRPTTEVKEKTVSNYYPSKPHENSRRWNSGLPPKLPGLVKQATPAIEAL